MQGSTIVTINGAGTILSVDEGFGKIFGYAFEDLVGHSINMIIPPPWKEQHDTYIANYLNSKQPKVLGKTRIVEGQHKDGSVFQIRIAVSIVNENEQSVFVGVIEKIEDLSAEITIGSNGNVVNCSQSTEQLLGFKADELIGKSANIILANLVADSNDGLLKRYLDGIANHTLGHTRTMMIKSKDGCSFPLSVKIDEVRVGEIRFYRANLVKVDHMEAVFTLSEDGTILACNENFVLALFGFKKDDLVGQHLASLIPNICGSYIEKTFVVDRSSNSATSVQQEDDGEPSAKRQRSVRSLEKWKTTGIHEYNVVHKDGSSCPVIFEIYPIITPPRANESTSSSTSSTTATPESSPANVADTINTSANVLDADHKTRVDTSKLIPRFCVKMKRAEFIHSANHEHCHDNHKEVVGPYILAETVGQGTYGKVKLAHHKDTNAKVAVKILVKANMKPHEIERVHREIEIMRALNHDNIAKLLDVIETTEAINLVMEFAGRTLTAITEAGKPLNDAESRRVFHQIASAVKFCHDLKVIHRDLKHQNILLDDADNCKLIDFGLSNFMEEGKMRSTFCGTPAFAAPEMILAKKYTGPEVDIWSLGVILYSVISGTFPFDNVADIIRGTYSAPMGASAECFDLIKHMLQPDCETRYNIDQILNHKWLKDPSPFREMSSATIAAAAPPVNNTSNAYTQDSQTQPTDEQPKEIECTVVEPQAGANGNGTQP